MAGSWVCEPCPVSSFTGENSTLQTPAQFCRWRRQPLTRDQGPGRIPGHTAPVWSGYLLLLRGSPTEPRVLVHEAGILILGFSQLQFLRDQRSSGGGAWHPPSSSPLPTQRTLPSQSRLSFPTWSLQQPGKESPAAQEGKRVLEGKRDGRRAAREPTTWLAWGPGKLASGGPSKAHQLLTSPLPLSGFLLQALTFLPLLAKLRLLWGQNGGLLMWEGRAAHNRSPPALDLGTYQLLHPLLFLCLP